MRKNTNRLKKTFFYVVGGFFVAGPAAGSQTGAIPTGPISGPFFNHSERSHYKDPYRGIYRAGHDLEALLIREIESARATLDIAVQEIRLPNVAKALARKRHSGVRVRLLLENQYNFTIAELDPSGIGIRNDHSNRRVQEYFRFVDMNGDGRLSAFEISQRDALWILRNASIPISDDTADGSKGSALMHHKFIVIDGKRVLVTSANFTMSDVHGDYSSTVSRGNANALLVFENPDLVREFQREFDILWGGGPGDKTSPPRFGVRKPYRGAVRTSLGLASSVVVQFSPTPKSLGFEASTSGLIERQLNRAQRSVDLALFVFSEQRFADALDRLRQRFPLNIRVLVEPTFAYAWFSEVLDMMGLQLWGPNCVRDLGNKPWKNPIHTVGIPRLPSGDFLHHKFAVIDGKVTVFGSQNWSNAANDSNDENLLVVEDVGVSRQFGEEFQRLYRSALLGPTKGLRDRIVEREAACGPMP